MLGGAELPLLWAALLAASLVDAALRFASLARLEEELHRPEARARYADYLEESRAVGAVSMLAQAAAATALVGLILMRAQREGGSLLAAGAAAGALVALAEAIARLIGRHWSSEVLVVLLPPFHWLAWPLRRVDDLVCRWLPQLGKAPEPEVVEAAKEELRVAIEDAAGEGALEKDEVQMIRGVMRVGEASISQIMTPRTDMECLEAHLPLAEAVPRLMAMRHSRIPVYEGTRDRVLGVVYVRDVLAALAGPGAALDGATLRDVMREVLFVPETMGVGALLDQFQRERLQIAVVLDEYGGVVGLVTVQDIMEEIVGELRDEYDQEGPEGRVRRCPGGELEVDARVRIEEVNGLLDADIPVDEDYDTIGGYVTDRLARVPEPGEEFEDHGLRVRILQSDKRRVRRVRIERLA